jgi:hypothetical protein
MSVVYFREYKLIFNRNDQPEALYDVLFDPFEKRNLLPFFADLALHYLNYLNMSFSGVSSESNDLDYKYEVEIDNRRILQTRIANKDDAVARQSNLQLQTQENSSFQTTQNFNPSPQLSGPYLQYMSILISKGHHLLYNFINHGNEAHEIYKSKHWFHKYPATKESSTKFLFSNKRTPILPGGHLGSEYKRNDLFNLWSCHPKPMSPTTSSQSLFEAKPKTPPNSNQIIRADPMETVMGKLRTFRSSDLPIHSSCECTMKWGLDVDPFPFHEAKKMIEDMKPGMVPSVSLMLVKRYSNPALKKFYCDPNPAFIKFLPVNTPQKSATENFKRVEAENIRRAAEIQMQKAKAAAMSNANSTLRRMPTKPVIQPDMTQQQVINFIQKKFNARNKDYAQIEAIMNEAMEDVTGAELIIDEDPVRVVPPVRKSIRHVRTNINARPKQTTQSVNSFASVDITPRIDHNGIISTNNNVYDIYAKSANSQLEGQGVPSAN